MGTIFFNPSVMVAHCPYIRSPGRRNHKQGISDVHLRRVGNLPFIVLVPSFIFGLIHLGNNGVTFFSVCNIILAGLLFSYMYIRSGNIWMCIGYHFTWNSFQGLVFGMPVSGINVTGMITTHFTANNFITGGIFGIEGGILTTLVTLLGFLFVKYYYRNSTYDFIKDV